MLQQLIHLSSHNDCNELSIIKKVREMVQLKDLENELIVVEDLLGLAIMDTIKVAGTNANEKLIVALNKKLNDARAKLRKLLSYD